MADTIVVAWYRPETYDRIRALEPAGLNSLQPTYEDWLRHAQAVLDRLEARGDIVRRIDVDPDALAAFLASGNLQCDEKSRARFVWEIAAAEESRKQ